MRLPRWMGCGMASVLLFSGILLLNPLPRTQIEKTCTSAAGNSTLSPGRPAFNPHNFRVCVDICQVVVETCFIECTMGGSPPEFYPADCLYYCNHVGIDCREEACRGSLPPN